MKKIVFLLTLIWCGCSVAKEFDDVFEFDYKVIANSDGTLSIESRVKTNVKIAEYDLTDADGVIVNDFVASDSRNDGFGSGNTGDFYLTFSGNATNIPVKVYVLTAQDKNRKCFKNIIGERFSIQAGGSADGEFSLMENPADNELKINAEGLLTGKALILDESGNQTGAAAKGTVITQDYIASFEVAKNMITDRLFDYCISGTIIRGNGNNYDFSNIIY